MSHYEEPVASLDLAPISRRALARVIDAGMLGIVGFALILPFMIAAVGLDEPGSHGKDGGVWSGTAVFGWILVIAILPFAYEAVQLALWGRTVGKRLTGIRVVSADGARLRPSQALVRSAIYALPPAARPVPVLNVIAGIFWLAEIGLLFEGEHRQALHDRAVGTLVIDTRPRPAPVAEPEDVPLSDV